MLRTLVGDTLGRGTPYDVLPRDCSTTFVFPYFLIYLRVLQKAFNESNTKKCGINEPRVPTHCDFNEAINLTVIKSLRFTARSKISVLLLRKEFIF